MYNMQFFIIMASGGMIQMSGHLVRSNFFGIDWSLHWTGFFVGLLHGAFSPAVPRQHSIDRLAA